MVNGEFTFKRSLSQCVQSFDTPACTQQVIFYCIDVAICIFAWVQLGRRFWYDTCLRMPKIKLLILLCLALGATFNLVYEANFTQHWSFYTCTFFDDLYFMWVVYYFGKKGLFAMSYHSLLKYYKLGLAILVLLFASYFLYNLIDDSINQTHHVCSNLWYTYSRAVVLLLEFALCVIGFCIYQRLNDRITEASVFSREETMTNLLKKSKKDLLTLITLIGIFLISDIVLLTQAIFFQLDPSLNCEFFPHNSTANLFTTLPILIFGYFAPRLCTIWVFRFNKTFIESTRSRMQSQHTVEIQLAIRKQTTSRTNSLMDRSIASTVQ